MKRLKLGLLVIVLIFGMIGCVNQEGQSIFPKQKSVCDEISPGESVLCDMATKYGVQLETADVIIRSGITLGVGLGIKGDAKRNETIDKLIIVGDKACQYASGEGAYYGEFLSLIKTDSREIGVVQFVATDTLDQLFGAPEIAKVLIKSKDVGFICRAWARDKKRLQAMKGE